MSRRITFLTASVIAAVVFAGSTPAQAADLTAVKRAIVITVLNNLGVRPTAELIDALVNEIPMDALDSGLVRQVGNALDNNVDASQIIGQRVDSDGDGVPDEDGATNASSEDEAEEEDEESSDSNSNAGSSSSGGGTNTRPPNNDDEEVNTDDDTNVDDEDGDDDDN
jgi:hypothetical protein